MSFRWPVVLLFPMWLQAAPMETMAWHFAVRPELAFLEGSRMHLENPPDVQSPASSVFFAKGEKLKDLSEPFRSHYHLKSDSWLVWNESRRLLVAHGAPIVLWQIENWAGFRNQADHTSITLSWYLGIQPGQPLPADAKPVHQSTIVARSGTKVSHSWASSEPSRLTSAKIEAEPINGNSELPSDLTLNFSWRETFNGKTCCWTCDLACVRDDSAPPVVLVQVDSPAGGSWTVTAASTITMADGYPLAKARFREVEGKETISLEYPEYIRDGQITKIETSKGDIPIQVLPVFDKLDVETDGQPWAPRSFSDPVSNEATDPVIELPEHLKPWFPLYLIDFRERLKLFQIQIPEDAVAGYDPPSGRLFLKGVNEPAMGDLIQLIRVGWRSLPHSIAVQTKLTSSDTEGHAEQKGCYILAKNGRKASLTCLSEKDSPLSDFAVEAASNDSGNSIFLGYAMEFAFPSLDCNGSITLPDGTETEVLTTKLEAGGSLTETLKATIIPFSRSQAYGSLPLPPN